jgi:hypothetical protein
MKTRDRKSFEGWIEFTGTADKMNPDVLVVMYEAWKASKAFYLAEVERFVGMRLDEVEAEARGETDE